MSTTKKSTEQVPFLERPIVRTILPIAGFVIICVLFAILTDGRLFQPKNISLLLSQSYMLLISSIGVFMVMTMGGLDFSQGSMLGVASIVVCYLSHYNMVLAALGGVVTGGLIGLINGYFNVKRKITSFIVTICTMYLFRGVCAYATTNSPVYAVSDISKYNTLPFMLTFTVIIFVVAYLVFTYTGLGSRLKAIGAGETAARFAGIRVETTKILVFVAAGCITGLAAFVNAIKVGSVTSTAGNQLAFYPEDVLIEKMESGEYGWLDYVNHFSAEWQDELAEYCTERALEINDASAEQFVHYKSEQLEAAMESGEA